jgi:hypothetical protein
MPARLIFSLTLQRHWSIYPTIIFGANRPYSPYAASLFSKSTFIKGV